MSPKPPAPERLAPVATANAAERAADHARAETIAAQPNPSMAKGVAQNLMAQPGLAQNTENVARRAAERPLASPAARIPPEKQP
jgi:hypothetical protein